MKKVFTTGLIFMVLGIAVLFTGCAGDIKVTFDAVEGTPEPTDREIKVGDLIIEPDPAPTKAGYTFDG